MEKYHFVLPLSRFDGVLSVSVALETRLLLERRPTPEEEEGKMCHINFSSHSVPPVRLKKEIPSKDAPRNKSILAVRTIAYVPMRNCTRLDVTNDKPIGFVGDLCRIIIYPPFTLASFHHSHKRRWWGMDSVTFLGITAQVRGSRHSFLCHYHTWAPTFFKRGKIASKSVAPPKNGFRGGNIFAFLGEG